MIYIIKPKLLELKDEIVKSQAARTSLSLSGDQVELLSSLIEFYEFEQAK